MHFSKTTVKWEEKQKYPSKCAASVDLFWIRKLNLLTVITCVISVHHCSFINICLVKTPLISLLERNAGNSGAIWKKRVQQLSFAWKLNIFSVRQKSPPLNVAPTLQQSGCGSITATRLAAPEDALALSTTSTWSTRGAERGGQVHIQLERDTMWWGFPLPCRQMQAHPGQSHHPLCIFTQQMAKNKLNKLKDGRLSKKKKNLGF